jgi:hypothetical protein
VAASSLETAGPVVPVVVRAELAALVELLRLLVKEMRVVP